VDRRHRRPDRQRPARSRHRPAAALDLQLFSDVARSTYQVFPDGSDEIWGLPQEGDVQVLFVRTDIVNDPDEMAAFGASMGLPFRAASRNGKP
jgi:hypothetical protein